MRRRKINIIWLITSFLLLLTAWQTWAGSSSLTPKKLLASDTETGDGLGNGVALSADGKTALVSAWGDNVGLGAAYIFTRSYDGWIEKTKLAAGDGVPGDAFGYAVALSGDGRTALVSSFTTNYQGTAYVFTQAPDGSWTEQAKLVALDGVANDGFGWTLSLSVNGNTALVGAVGKEGCKGAAYIFSRALDGSWTQEAELSAADGTANDAFGYALSLSANGNTALIEASVGGDQKTGVAYVFSHVGGIWVQQAKLTVADSTVDDMFGTSLALSADGRTALIGAPGRNKNKGSAYVFIRSGLSWKQLTQLTAADGAQGDGFGFPVALSADGKTALIAALWKSNSQGAAYLFTRARTSRRWTQRSRLVAPISPTEDQEQETFGDLFGYAVALSAYGDTALIGSLWDDEQGTDAGAAYVFMNKSPKHGAGKSHLDQPISSLRAQ